ncbi:MAG TPA: THUMP domain-containing protein, partial [Kofleriaceae bacterium]|nr:THUMP domain-containing protein [Kofleriaceae bacterium]
MTVAPGEAAIVLSVAEIFLKGRNRRDFFNALIRNARRLLADLPDARVVPLHLRALVVCPEDQVAAAAARLGRLFGLAAMAPATVVTPDMEAIGAAASACAARFPADSSFKIETTRRDKRFPLTSLEVSRDIGARVVADRGLAVDVHHPDHRIAIEIDERHAFVRGDAIAGPGGLPVGTAGNVSLLLSGGIDSPVAGWYAMRRGCRL